MTLQDAIPKIEANDTTLESISLGYNQIDDAFAKALAKALEKNTTLRSIDLGGNQIGADGTKALAEALLQNTALTSIYLMHNQIGDEGATALAEALLQNTTLSSINLRGNQIGAAGTKALAEALEKNTTLTSIDLRWNEIDAAGTKALAEALLQNTTLTSIDLGGNDIGDEGATALAKALEKNTTLTSINLGGNDIGDEGAKDLAVALKSNTTIAWINLENKNIGDDVEEEVAEEIENLLRRNRQNISPFNCSLREIAYILENNDVDLTKINVELENAQGLLNELAQYEEVYPKLKCQFDSIVVDIYLWQNNLCEAINYFNSNPNIFPEKIFALAEKIYTNPELFPDKETRLRSILYLFQNEHARAQDNATDFLAHVVADLKHPNEGKNLTDKATLQEIEEALNPLKALVRINQSNANTDSAAPYTDNRFFRRENPAVNDRKRSIDISQPDLEKPTKRARSEGNT